MKYSRRLIVLYLVILPNASSAPASPATPGKNPPVTANQFNRTARFPAREKPTAVIYGHEKYGFYRTDAFRFMDGRVEIDLIPPGYRHSIEFWAERPLGRPARLGSQQFRSPLPPFLRRMEGKNERGNFSFNFLIYNNELAGSDGVPIKFPVIANRQGEIVWAHFIHGGRPFFAQDLHAQPIAPGVMGIMTTLGDSYFEAVTMDGVVKYSFHGSRLSPPARVFHHDFLPIDDRRILFLDYAQKYSVGFAWPPIWETYSDVVVEVDVPTRTRKVVWSGADLGPFQFPRFIRADFAASFLSRICARNRFCGKWRADEQLHANAILKLPNRNGYLISLRGTSQLVKTGEAFAEPDQLWATHKDSPVVIEATDKSVRMSHQHRPVLSPRGTVLVFNNHAGRVEHEGSEIASSNVLEISLSQPPRIVRVYKPSPPVHAPYRSSVGSTPSGNVVAYFSIANATSPRRSSDVLVEFDQASAREIARMELPVLHSGSKWSTHMGLPALSLDGEKFLGNAVPGSSDKDPTAQKRRATEHGGKGQKDRG